MNEDLALCVGSVIKEARISLRMPRSRVADVMQSRGYDRMTVEIVTRIEGGDWPLTASLLSAICPIVGLDPDDAVLSAGQGLTAMRRAFREPDATQ